MMNISHFDHVHPIPQNVQTHKCNKQEPTAFGGFMPGTDPRIKQHFFVELISPKIFLFLFFNIIQCKYLRKQYQPCPSVQMHYLKEMTTLNREIQITTINKRKGQDNRNMQHI